MPDLRVRNVNKTFNGSKVLQDINFDVHDGEFFTLLGPSGCGKSTTLSCIAGLERPDEGTIELDDTVFFSGADGTFVAPEGRNLGMVFQSYALWPHMTIADNLALPLKLRKVTKSKRNGLIDDALEKVDLLHLRDRYPHEMSGGQQQRVALARALVYSPRLLLLDEPLSNLDAKLREQARAWLKALQSEVGITTIYVTHDQDEALAMSDRIAVMSKGEMVQIDTPTEIYEQPAAREVAGFVGSCNFLAGKVVEASDADARVQLEATGQVVHATGRMDVHTGDTVSVAVRPERVNIAAVGTTHAEGHNVVRASVSSVLYVGRKYEYLLTVGNSTITADCLKAGHQGEVDLVIDPENIFLYPQKQMAGAS
ncbi:ABC transporter ATP-binding protein [Mycolicibacterium mageritense DSM 44476 = CIP 104973]|uniref:ABC transporter ATP-binding protein n=1 Tax=Mycolicibacterium mageritense TaxID=53462 RepID=A0ABM7HP00_MYCME|nr:ABC transporter ATP-binding protein [Mycolicibacterium mageritense]OKH80510.1 ABC transporter ATP-binding protein [Mycobacterium sp. SWH-M3]MCC9181421.1 ABC transporter ATP-binding protein [Mycolicibacterium mageritense]CDO23209.1 spermidine/putrescine ABC transporter ATPase [Mycolicibacterium mageritense DSM 44476 = CIP 104973]BBX32248.1 ABC transporter ATP-binding protein [Mycolicibacterium mageritense]GJJ20896.1 ABC transporter ATP-binding protein [Mycolicibacterium mageritense]